MLIGREMIEYAWRCGGVVMGIMAEALIVMTTVAALALPFIIVFNRSFEPTPTPESRFVEFT